MVFVRPGAEGPAGGLSADREARCCDSGMATAHMFCKPYVCLICVCVVGYRGGGYYAAGAADIRAAGAPGGLLRPAPQQQPADPCE